MESRKELIKTYSLLKYEHEEVLKDGLNLSKINPKTYPDSFTRFLLNFKDRKDFIMCLLEDQTVDSITHLSL